MRPMVLEFQDDRSCEDLDLQYMLGPSLLVAPAFSADHRVEYYLPQGRWTHLLDGRVLDGGRWVKECYDYFSLPLFVRENTILPLGHDEEHVAYNYLDQLELHLYQITGSARAALVSKEGRPVLRVYVVRDGDSLQITLEGDHQGASVVVHQDGKSCRAQIHPGVMTAVV